MSNDFNKSENEKSSAKIQAELYEKDKRITFAQYCKFILSLPLPMSYELWRQLHIICEEECLE